MGFASCLKLAALGLGSQVFGVIGLALFLVFSCGTFKILQARRLFKGSNSVQLFCNNGGEKALLLGRDLGKQGLSKAFDQRNSPSKCIADGIFYLVAKTRSLQTGLGIDNAADNNSEELDHFEGYSDGEAGEEDEEDDVASLRRLVKAQRERANRARDELERERLASASAAQEALTRILEHQTEKSRIELAGNQYRREAEERVNYLEGLIEDLQLIIAAQMDETRRLEEEIVELTR